MVDLVYRCTKYNIYVIEINCFACSAGGYCISNQGLISPAKKDSLSSCPCLTLFTVCCKILTCRSDLYPGASSADPDPTKMIRICKTTVIRIEFVADSLPAFCAMGIYIFQ